MQNDAISVFEGKSVIFKYKKELVVSLWKDVCKKLSKMKLDAIPEHREEFMIIFDEMQGSNIVDLSPLKDLMDSLFELATSYDQKRSSLADKMSESKKQELLLEANERLQSFLLEKNWEGWANFFKAGDAKDHQS